MSRKSQDKRPIDTLRCAIYTRKSTDEGLEKEFNSLDAQRDACEAYLRSQQHQGWTLLPQLYDDGGFTGGNMERPALKRLMADIEAGQIDCVVIYKVDRLSRSLLDFARMMEAFEKHKVSFVSITQQFNTATSMGRLVLNVLLSFAQFEREIISERTRDKIAASRRKGKWVGGHPLLGYDVDPHTFKLTINPEEAEQVREIFRLYLEQGSLLPVVIELERRGWVNKRWQTRKGGERGGKPFDRTALHRLLTNVTYIGRVRHKLNTYAGEHPAIVDEATFAAVQATLRQNRRDNAERRRSTNGFLLQGLLRCLPCDSAMTPTYTTRNRSKRYRYYICSSALKRGRHTCVTRSVPAAQLEQFVIDQLRQRPELDPELDGGWEHMTSDEQADRLRRLVERVDYDGGNAKLAIRLRAPTIGIRNNLGAADEWCEVCRGGVPCRAG